MKSKLTAILTAILVVAWAHGALAAVSFGTFVNSTGGQPIGFAYAGNKFVGSNYFSNQLYQSDLNGANVQAFGSPIPWVGAIGEVYVSSSLGLGGFGSRDVFAGSQFEDKVYRIANAGGAPSLFASGLAGGVRGIAFDPYGSYNNNMVVTTFSGNVYRVNSAGVVSLMTNVGGDAEGLDFAPQQFGNFPAGTLVVVSEGTGRLNAIAPDNTKTDLGLQFSVPEMLSFVPTTLGSSGSSLEGFYAANYPVNVIKAGADQFTSFLGDAVITEENSHQMYHIFWDGDSFEKVNIGAFPNQPEDGIFITARILQPNPIPEPETYAMMLAGLGMLVIAYRRKRKHSETRLV